MDTALGTLLRYAIGRLSTTLEYAPLGMGIGHALVGVVRRVVLTGVGVTGPFLVTFMVLGFVLNFVTGALDPFVAVLDVAGVTAGATQVEAQLLSVVLISGVVFVVGLATEASPDTRVGDHVERAVEAIPAVGSVYTSFDRMSDVLLEGDANSFQEVKLVEFPQADTYALAFVTADGPTSVSRATDEGEMQVLFVPMAPNPVMGGYMVFVPTDRVIDVEMTVQEAFQAIVTSGVAAGDPADSAPAAPALE